MDGQDEDSVDRFETAAQWWTRLDAGAMTASEFAAFRAWLASDARNEAALEEVCALWGKFGQLPSTVVASYVAAQSAPAHPNRWRWGGIAFAAVLTAAAFVDDIWTLLRADFRTGVGETTSVTLPDGSTAHLAAGSALALDFDGNQRKLSLLRGEALFEVEPDPSRPFSVTAGGGSVEARGTAFDISLERGRTEITVTEHAVEVGRLGVNVTVPAGRQTAYGPDLAPVAPYEVDPEGVTAWRRGKLYFKDKPLGDVLSTLGRYRHGVILVADPRIRDRRVTGMFDAAQPLDAIRAIEKSLGLRSTRLSDYLILLHL